jgi:hypothetical protein
VSKYELCLVKYSIWKSQSEPVVFINIYKTLHLFYIILSSLDYNYLIWIPLGMIYIHLTCL